MENKRPKRRKDKYNPYSLRETAGHYYVSFKDGQNILQEIEISEHIFQAFNDFELEDLVYLNVWDRHLEQSEVCEQTLNQRAFQKPEGIEESVLDMLEMEQLHKAIVNLPEFQRRRIVQYYFEGLTYQQIARKELIRVKAELERVLKLKKSVYEDYKEGMILKEEFFAYREDYLKKEELYKKQTETLEEKVKESVVKDIFQTPWLKRLLEMRDIEKLDRDMIVKIIDQIVVYENHKIKISYNFGNELENLFSNFYQEGKAV